LRKENDYNPAALGAEGEVVGGWRVGDPRLGMSKVLYRNFMGGGGVDTGAFNQFQGTFKTLVELEVGLQSTKLT
jgi:hypothetical protein